MICTAVMLSSQMITSIAMSKSPCFSSQTNNRKILILIFLSSCLKRVVLFSNTRFTLVQMEIHNIFLKKMYNVWQDK